MGVLFKLIPSVREKTTLKRGFFSIQRTAKYGLWQIEGSWQEAVVFKPAGKSSCCLPGGPSETKGDCMHCPCEGDWALAQGIIVHREPTEWLL